MNRVSEDIELGKDLRPVSTTEGAQAAIWWIPMVILLICVLVGTTCSGIFYRSPLVRFAGSISAFFALVAAIAVLGIFGLVTGVWAPAHAVGDGFGLLFSGGAPRLVAVFGLITLSLPFIVLIVRSLRRYIRERTQQAR